MRFEDFLRDAVDAAENGKLPVFVCAAAAAASPRAREVLLLAKTIIETVNSIGKPEGE